MIAVVVIVMTGVGMPLAKWATLPPIAQTQNRSRSHGVKPHQPLK